MRSSYLAKAARYLWMALPLLIGLMIAGPAAANVIVNVMGDDATTPITILAWWYSTTDMTSNSHGIWLVRHRLLSGQ
jgi:hypothetical protein